MLLPSMWLNSSASSFQPAVPSTREYTVLPVSSWLPGFPPAPWNWLPLHTATAVEASMPWTGSRIESTPPGSVDVGMCQALPGSAAAFVAIAITAAAHSRPRRGASTTA